MPDVEFTNLLRVAVIALLAPLTLGLAPRLRLPAVVLEIVTGIVVGPQVLGWVEVDLPVSIVSLLGLAFLLFLAGLEIHTDPARTRRDTTHTVHITSRRNHMLRRWMLTSGLAAKRHRASDVAPQPR